MTKYQEIRWWCRTIYTWLNRKRRQVLLFFGAQETSIEGMCRVGHGPACHGGAKGPSSKIWRDLQYDHLHLPTSMKKQAAQAEADGTLKRNPALRKYLNKALSRMKGREEAWPHLDYQKLGHPSTLAHRKDLRPKI